MIVARTSLKDQEILIEAVDEQVEYAGPSTTPRTVDTGIEDKFKGAYDSLKSVVSTIAADFANSFTAAKGQKIELEFSMSLSATTGVWIVSGKGECAIKVKMVWEP
jgi:hypothetical protein